jgi:FtsP/CotA-like multicopper oxidase with cupredoxin domain
MANGMAHDSDKDMGDDHATMHHGMQIPQQQEHEHERGIGVDNVPGQTREMLDEPGLGLAGVGHRVLTYADLKSLLPNPDRRKPGRTIELHLTGNMERYMWSFDGLKFSEVTGPVEFVYGERLRLVLVNDTVMSHPIHLHGMFVELVNGNGAFNPRKHTVVLKPAEKLAVDITADAPGNWAFHCHLLYHMMAGMMRMVSVVAAGEVTS